MTVITIKDGVLACDSGVFDGGVFVGTAEKAKRLGDGSIVAGAGPLSGLQSYLNYLGRNNGSEPDHLVQGTMLMRLTRSGAAQVRMSGEGREWIAANAPFHAIGSGYRIAIGAMAAGASAEEAVRIACEHDEGCRGPVRIFKAGERP